MSVPNPLKAVLEGKRNVLFDEEPQVQIGDDDSHLILYPEINPEDKSKAPETLTDTNTVYVSNSAGNNANPGTSASPKKTVNSAITKAGTSDAYKYICLKANTYIYVEDIHLPVNLTVYNDTGVSSSIRMIMRDIPATMNDANTKWVDVNSGDDSTGSGTRAAPYKTVNKAINDISTNAFLYVAVLIDDTHYQSTENICWIPGSSVTQTVKIVPYMDELSGSEMKPGKTLELLFDKSQDNNTIGGFINKIKKAYVVTSNFSASNKEEIFFVNTSTNTNALEKTSDFKTITGINSTSSKKWTGLVEYFYSGHWYLITAAPETGTGNQFRVFYYKDDGTSGEYVVTTSSTSIYEVEIGGNENNLFVCSWETMYGGHYQICTLRDNANPTSATAWEELFYQTYVASDYASNIIRNITDDNFIIYEGISRIVFYYNGDLGTLDTFYDRYDTGFDYDSAGINGKFTDIWYDYSSGKLLAFDETIKDSKSVIVEIDINNVEVSIYHYVNTQNFYSFYNKGHARYGDNIYFYARNSSSNYSIFMWDGTEITQITTDLTTPAGSLCLTDQPVYKGLIPYARTSTSIAVVNIANISAFGKLNIEGCNINNDKIGICAVANNIETAYSKYHNAITGLNCKENTNNKIEKSIFTDCNTSLFMELSIGHSIEYCLLYNFITGIYYKAQTNSTSAYDCEMKFITADLGTTFYKANARTVTAGSQSSITASIISRIGYPVNSEESIDVDVDYTILPTGGSYTGENIEDTCVIAQPVFRNRDASPPDYRLQKKWIVASNGIAYLFDSPGIDFYNDSGTDYDAGCYRFDRDLYHNIWDYEWQCDFNPSAVAIAQSFQNMSEFISVSGIKLPTHYGEPNRLVIPWIPKTATEMRTLRNLYAIIRRLEKARLTLNPWDDYSETDLENLAQAGDLGIFSGPSAIGGGASIIATFYPDDMKLVQSENTFIEDEFKGWLVYINYDDSGTRKGFYLKITSNDETTLYLKDVDGLDTIPSSAIDNQSDEMIYIIGAMYVRCNTQALESNLSIWYRNSGPVMGTIDIEFIEA